ncbi:MAG: glycosyltransferase family 39 protein [Synechococcales bacterium]|nr:glycosyltransferase family 39 protein [Synechococcales bacterium]
MIATLVLGIFFRLAHLDRKIYWHDEVFTSLRAAGYIGEEVGAQLFDGEIRAVSDLLVYQSLNPELGWDDTWRSLQTHPEHPPLYYLLARLWMSWFGSSVAAVRSLSVLFGLLALPAMYWLARELFAQPLTPWVAIALFAVSPFQVLYAQEARQYSLWVLATLLASAALLRALRRPSPGRWLLYAATLMLNFYTSLFSVLTVMAHGLYSLARNRGRVRPLLPMVGAIALAGVCFLPWIVVLLSNWDEFQRKTGWTNHRGDRAFLAKLWGLHFSSSLVDWGLDISHPYTYIVPPLVLALLGYAVYVLYRHRPVGAAEQPWLFIGLLMLMPVVAFILPDLVLGGQRSAHTRYFVLSQVGIQLAIAALITHHLSQPAGRSRQFTTGFLSLLLILGVTSCTLSAQAHTWWSKGLSFWNGAVATVLNPLEAPLVVSPAGATSLGNVLSLAHAVDGDTRFQLLPAGAVPDLAGTSGERFLFHPSDRFLQALQATPITLEPLVPPRDDRLTPVNYALSRLRTPSAE